MKISDVANRVLRRVENCKNPQIVYDKIDLFAQLSPEELLLVIARLKEILDQKFNANDFTEAICEERAVWAKNAHLLNHLFSGGCRRYSPWGQAVKVFNKGLAFWTCRDSEAMDRYFRQSALMRPEWDRVNPKNGLTYGQEVIRQAIKACRKTFFLPAC